MKQSSMSRSSLAFVVLALAGQSVWATVPASSTTTTTGTITSTDRRVVDNYTTTVTKTGGLTTTKTTETIKFVDPTLALINSSDEVSQLSVNTKKGGTMTVTANGENGNSAATTKTKLVVASNILGTIGLGVDSCNRNILGLEVNSGGSCGHDFDIDEFVKSGKLFAESITVTFGSNVTLDSVTLADGPFGGNAFAVAIDGDLTHLHAFKMGSLLLWRSIDVALTGHSFTFLAYDPIGCKSFDDFYLSGLTFYSKTVSGVPEPEALALVLAGLAVVGVRSRRKS